MEAEGQSESRAGPGSGSPAADQGSAFSWGPTAVSPLITPFLEARGL